MTAFSLIEPCISQDPVLSLQSWVNPFYWLECRLSAFLIKQGPFSSRSGSELKAGWERNDKWKAFQPPRQNLHIREVFSSSHTLAARLSCIVLAKRLSPYPFSCDFCNSGFKACGVGSIVSPSICRSACQIKFTGSWLALSIWTPVWASFLGLTFWTEVC